MYPPSSSSSSSSAGTSTPRVVPRFASMTTQLRSASGSGPVAVRPVPDERGFRSSPRGTRSSQPVPSTPSKRARTPNLSRVPGYKDPVRSPVVNVLSPASDTASGSPAGAATSPPPGSVADPVAAAVAESDYLLTHYTVEGRLDRGDQGSFSEVYLVRSRADSSLSAVKKIRQAYTGSKDRYGPAPA
jgi:hypothetical protein